MDQRAVRVELGQNGTPPRTRIIGAPRGRSAVEAHRVTVGCTSCRATITTHEQRFADALSPVIRLGAARRSSANGLRGSGREP